MDNSRSDRKRNKRRKSSSSGSRSRRKSSRGESEESGIGLHSELQSRLRPTGSVRRLKWYEKLLIYLLGGICLGAIITTLLVWKSRSAEPLTWTDYAKLPPVKPAPASVSSEVDSNNAAYIEPFVCRGHARYVMEKINQILRQDLAYRNIRFDQREGQLQAVAVTPLLGFHDDVIFQVREDPERIAIYSTSRVGVGDIGANRKRLDALRETLRNSGVLK